MMFGQTSRYRDNRERLARRKGFKSDLSYLDYLAQTRGFGSDTKYRKEMARRRQSNQDNQALRDLINKRLQDLGKNQSWLARQIGRSRQSVSFYGQGKALPKNDETLWRIYSVLGSTSLTNK